MAAADPRPGDPAGQLAASPACSPGTAPSSFPRNGGTSCRMPSRFLPSLVRRRGKSRRPGCSARPARRTCSAGRVKVLGADLARQPLRRRPRRARVSPLPAGPVPFGLDQPGLPPDGYRALLAPPLVPPALRHDARLSPQALGGLLRPPGVVGGGVLSRPAAAPSASRWAGAAARLPGRRAGSRCWRPTSTAGDARAARLDPHRPACPRHRPAVPARICGPRRRSTGWSPSAPWTWRAPPGCDLQQGSRDLALVGLRHGASGLAANGAWPSWMAAMRCLKPGGIAVHTTELTWMRRAATLSPGATVLYQRNHLEAACGAAGRAAGHRHAAARRTCSRRASWTVRGPPTLAEGRLPLGAASPAASPAFHRGPSRRPRPESGRPEMPDAFVKANCRRSCPTSRRSWLRSLCGSIRQQPAMYLDHMLHCLRHWMSYRPERRYMRGQAEPPVVRQAKPEGVNGLQIQRPLPSTSCTHCSPTAGRAFQAASAETWVTSSCVAARRAPAASATR